VRAVSLQRKHIRKTGNCISSPFADGRGGMIFITRVNDSALWVDIQMVNGYEQNRKRGAFSPFVNRHFFMAAYKP
jgi:hypothetical protein